MENPMQSSTEEETKGETEAFETTHQVLLKSSNKFTRPRRQSVHHDKDLAFDSIGAAAPQGGERMNFTR